MNPKEIRERTVAASEDRASIEKIRAELDRSISQIDSRFTRETVVDLEARYREKAKEDGASFAGRAQKLHEWAMAQLGSYSLETILKRAKFSDDAAVDATISVANQGRLTRATPKRLVEWTQQAVEDKNFALVALIQEERDSRGDALAFDVQERINQIIGTAEYNGPEPALLHDLAETTFEAVQEYNEITRGGRLYTAKQLEGMSQEQFEDAITRQRRAGLKQ
jgi:hypothetical protein